MISSTPRTSPSFQSVLGLSGCSLWQLTQAGADATYFLGVSDLPQSGERAERVRGTMLKAYRWQYIMSGAAHPHFQTVLGGLVNAAQLGRVQAALAPLAYAMPTRRDAARAAA